MEKKSFSREFYVNLYEAINRVVGDWYERYGNDSDDEFYNASRKFTTDCEVDVENYTVCLDATYEELLIDDSFDHAFGTEHAWHTELGEIIGIDNVEVFDNDTDEEVTKMFSEADFMEQFKVYETKVGGKVIKAGDAVLVCTSRPYIASGWRDGVYRYTDTRNGRHYCEVDGWKSPREFMHIMAKTA